MAQDAELKLKVSLDLGFFRQQLSTIGTQLGGQPLQLSVQFNKKSIADQYRLLDTYLGRKTFKIKIEAPTLDTLTEKVSTFKKNLVALGSEKINLAVNVVSNIDEVRKSIKDRLPSVGIDAKLNEPTNVDDFIREVGKKVKGQVEKSYVGGGIPIATKLETPGTTSLIKALQKNFNRQDPLRVKVTTAPLVRKSDATAFQSAVNEKFTGITAKVGFSFETANTADVISNIKSSLSIIPIGTQLAEPINVNDFIRDVKKKIDDQAKKIDVATRLQAPSIGDFLNALQEDLNNAKGIRINTDLESPLGISDFLASLQEDVNKAREIRVNTSLIDPVETSAFLANLQENFSKAQGVRVNTNLADPAESSAFLASLQKFINEAKGIDVDTQLKMPAIAAFLAALQQSLNEKADIGIDTKLRMPAIAALLSGIQEALGAANPVQIQTGLNTSIDKKDIAAFKKAVSQQFAGITVKVKAELEGAGQGASEQGGRNFSQAALRKLGQDIKPLYRAAADAGLVEFNESIANNVQSIAKELSNVSGDLIEGLLNGLKSKDPQIKAAAKNLGEALISSIKSILGIASPSKVFKAIGEDVGKGFELGATASMDRAFDELERKLQGRLNKLQAMLRMAPSRRSDFPFVAMGGPPESAPIAREIDQAYAQLAQIKERRQERLASERGSLAQAAGRMLPAGASAIPAVSGQDIVIKNFYKSMQDAQRMLQENFSANSYLPRATRNFAASMQQASQAIKAITGARGPIAALPSSEMLRPMMEQRQFQSAIMQAIKIDMQNALRQQMQGLMLPGAGQTSYKSPQQKEQQRFQEAMNKAAAIDAEKAAIFAARQARTQAGEMLRQTRAQMRVPALPAAGQSSFGLMKNRELQSSLANIGTFGRQETGGVQGIIASGKGSIFEKLKASAIAFAQNAPTVIKYLNLFRPERISVSDLPSEKEGPGQFVQRISQQLKEGLFGPGTRPAQSRQFFEFGQGAQLPGMPLQRALPPIGGSGGADRVTGMGQPPQRGGAIVPFAPATRLPEGYFENVKKYSAALEMARATSAKFTASQLPLVGGLREVASEFGFAIKQVLLFGTAYKALAFVQSLPGQILNAAKSQQQYNNALQTATQDTGTFAKELLYVDNVQRAFGLNLETTRTGFTRLYASMAPTGFDSGSIEKLFTGISAATAALQLTPDKAERVIYAFEQMASKGQIMSEELKGQLGDVLPGALAIFAKAAGEDALLAFDEGIINNKTRMAQALNKAAEDASAGFIAALENEKSALFKAAGEYGDALLSGLKKTLKIQSPSREMFDIGDDAGKGFELGLLKALELAEKSATNQMRRMLDRLARMALMMGGMSAAAINRQVAQSRALPGVNFPATVPPRQSIPIGPSSTGRMLPAGRAAAGMIGAAQAPVGLLPSMSGRSQTQAIVEALIAQQGPRMLPSGGGALVDTKRIYAELQKNLDNALRRMFTVLEASVFETGAGLKDGLDTFAYLAQALKDAEARSKQSRIVEEVDSLISRIETALRLAAARVNVRQVQIGIGASMQGALPSGRVAGLLTAGVGREPSRYAMGGESREQMMARRTAEAYARSALRGVSVMSEKQPALPGTTFMGDAFVSGGGRDRVTGSGQAPERGGALAFPGGTMGRATQLPSSYLALGKASAELKKFEGFFNTNKLPLAGAIEELAGEFGNATKQVLLYGTAYKALAFFMDLPNQALNAARSLQTFNNQLNAITGSSENADRAFAFVDNLAARFNVPLESARQGFVKLYASMAPAGFSSGEIENLFTGISKASATLGLSSDKVDRVTYAFSQMASKGQLMSEEVSGQLGDVIPGALSIMAEAARMDIATFKKAMEDGVFVGETFKQVMSNVPIVLENRFGKGAAGAAKTLQGSMNALAISTQKFYESFEPIVSMGAASIFPIIATAINDATQAVQAFTTAMQGNTTPAQMLEGNAAQIYGVLQQLREVFVAVAGIIQGIAPTLMIVGKAFLTTAEYIAKLVNTPIGGFLADLAVKAGIALIAIQLFAKTGIAGLISQLILLQRSTAAAGGGFLTFASTLTKTATAAKLFKLAIAGLVGAGILFGIEALVNAIGRMANRLSDARKNAIAARDAIKSMSGAELGEQIIVQQNKLQALSRTQKAGGKVGSEKDRQMLEQMGMKVSATSGTFVGGQLIGGKYAVDKNLIESFRIREEEQLKAIRDQRKSLYDTTPLPLNDVELGAGKEDSEGAKKALSDAEQLAKQEQQRRIEQAGFINDMEKLGFDYKMQLSDEAFEHQKRLIDERNQYELSGLNDIQAHQVKFAQDLKKVRLDAEDAIRKAIQKTQEAQLNVTAAQRTAQAAGVSPMGGQAIFGNTGRTSQAAGWVHGHFQTNTASLATLIGDVVPVVKQLLSQGIPVELSGGQKFNTGMSDADIAALLRKGASQHGHSGDGRSIDLFVPKGTAVPTPLSDVRNTGGRGGITGVLPGSGQSWVGHLDPRSKSGAKQSSASFSMDTKMQKESFDLQKQYAQSANQISLQTLEIERAIQLAKENTATIIKTNIDSLFPVEQQKLDIRLQQMRHNLLMQGMPQEYIDYEEKRAIATEKAAGMTKTMIVENDKARKTLEDYNQKIAKGIELLPSQKAEMAILDDQIKQNEQALKDLTKAQQESNIASLKSAIATMKQADALKAVEEASARINDAVTGVTDTYKSMFKEIAMGEDSVEALKKAQQALADQFLTMVFDIAMKPVEESMKNTLGTIFGVPNEKEQRDKTIDSMEAQLKELEAHKVHLKNIDANTSIAAGKTPASGTIPAPAAPAVPGQTTAAGIPGVSLAGTAALQTLPFNGQTGGMLQSLPFPTQDTGFLPSIGINSEEMKASMSESITAFSDQLGKFDASIADSAFAVDEAGTAISKGGPAGKKWQESLGQVVGGLGMAAGAVMGIVAGINQVKEGGTSNVLGGIGMIASMAGSLLGGFGGLFKGGAGASSIVQGTDVPIAQMPPGMQFANGGVAIKGFRAFANGGMVTGPTLGLVGEGKYNEAIVPLPDGKSIPVQLGGGSSRDLLSKGSSKQQNASPVLSMSFQTTKFGDKEYVDIGQLQAAMAETRRLAAREGAAQGSQLALNRLRNSPNTRRQLGLG